MDDEGEWEYLPITFEQALTLYKDTQVYWWCATVWDEWFDQTVDSSSIPKSHWSNTRLSIKVRRDES